MDRDEHLRVSALVASAPVRHAPAPADAPTRPAAVFTTPFAHSTARDARAWEVLANLALTVMCGVAIVLVLGLTIGPRFLAYETLIVRSGSMAPAIHTGALVIVQPVQPRDVKAGDVITYRRPEEPGITITHRVIDVRSGGAQAVPIFRTKGDANAVPDPWEVQLQGIAWRVTFSVPFAGFLFAFTQQPLGRALFLIVPGLGLASLWLHRTWLRLRRT